MQEEYWELLIVENEGKRWKWKQWIRDEKNFTGKIEVEFFSRMAKLLEIEVD